jgi:transposase
MLTLQISAADIATAKYERIHHPVIAIRKRMDAIFWTSQGKGRQEVAQLSNIHRNSVTTYIRLYNEGGIEALKTFYYKGFDSVLMRQKITIEDYFDKHPPRSVKEAAFMIENLTGDAMSLSEVRRFMHKIGMKPIKVGHIPAKADYDKQKDFLEKTLEPLIEKAKKGQCNLYFMDAAHFVLMPFLGILWSFKRLFIKAAPGRNRINVLGALNAVTLEMETLINTTYINAPCICVLLERLASKSKGLETYIILDNARYQHCILVKNYAEKLKIHLVFLPPYSPNLNLIERVWRYIKKDVLSTRYFDCASNFHKAITRAVEDINSNCKTKKDLKSLLNLKFQLFAQNLLA